MPEGKFGKYSYELIKPEEKDRLLRGLSQRYLHDRKASIHGMCIELLTDNREFKEMWEDNFFSMSHDVRPHGRIVAVRDENPDFIVGFNSDRSGFSRLDAMAAEEKASLDIGRDGSRA